LSKKKVLVIGGGAAGMTSALEMAERGTEVILVEKNSELGGRGATYCCKATDECNRCAQDMCLVTNNHQLLL
jgi:heterodisulfide reductase subunit A